MSDKVYFPGMKLGASTLIMPLTGNGKTRAIRWAALCECGKGHIIYPAVLAHAERNSIDHQKGRCRPCASGSRRKPYNCQSCKTTNPNHFGPSLKKLCVACERRGGRNGFCECGLAIYRQDMFCGECGRQNP